MVTVILTRTYRRVAVSTFYAVNTAVQFLTACAKAAVVTEGAHTAFAEPTLTAKIFRICKITVVTAQTVPTVINVTLLAGHTVTAPNSFCKTFATFVTVRIHKALCVGTLDTAVTADAAHIFVPMVMTATGTLLPVLVGGKNIGNKT